MWTNLRFHLSATSEIGDIKGYSDDEFCVVSTVRKVNLEGRSVYSAEFGQVSLDEILLDASYFAY